ncbi:hypothetical protein P7C71_g514, partial [Lecanoromycetidae sp. Uapishka_2]
MLLLVLSIFCLFVASGVAKQCQTLAIPVNINATNGVFNLPNIESNLDAVAFAQLINNIGGNFALDLLAGHKTITGEYTISAVYCQPAVASAVPAIQLLTHGIGFDKSYWDLPFDNCNYSYVDVAVDQYGFSTLAIDRFGIGASSSADPLNIVQVPTELSALYEVTMMLRRGTLPHVPHVFSKVVHVGHSFGSILSFNLAAAYPDASDGLILTGFAPNASFVATTFAAFNFKLASLNQPYRFGNINPALATQGNLEALLNVMSALGVPEQTLQSRYYTADFADFIAGTQAGSSPHQQNLPSGYLTWTDAGCNQFSFLHPGAFDPNILQYSEDNKFPFTTGEVLTLGGGPQAAPDFKGPVMVFTGMQDSIFCGGDCTATGNPNLASIPALTKLAFPAAKAFEAYLQPNTGHGINLHYNATAGYNVIQKFLDAQGLGLK